MKILSIILFAATSLSLASCETTREITLNADGSGKFSNTLDLSSMIGMAKMSGQKDIGEMEKANIDTSISLSKMADSIAGLSTNEKELIKKGTLDLKINMEDEKFVTRTLIPFSDPGQLERITVIAGKAMQQTIKKELGKGEGGENTPPGMGDGDIPEGSIDDYFTTTYSKTVIEKKLNTEKYATIGEDKGIQSLKEIAGQGLPINTTVIYNLPRPAKKVTGKNVKLSDDKKKVTITEPLDEFFENGKSLEYKIEY